MYFVEMIPTLILTAIGTALHPRDKRWMQMLFIAVIWMPMQGSMFMGLRSISADSVRYDEYFMVTERAFGYPSFHLGSFLLSHPGIRDIVRVDYEEFIFAAFIAVFVNLAVNVTIESEGVRSFRPFLATLLNPTIAALGYVILPAAGPGFAFDSFPVPPAISAPHVLHLTAPPNCFPSAHLSAAILVAYFLWRWKVGRILGSVHVILTVMGTLGLGEHYIVDLIAAVPYTALIVYLTDAIIRAAEAVPNNASDELENG